MEGPILIAECYSMGSLKGPGGIGTEGGNQDHKSYRKSMAEPQGLVRSARMASCSVPAAVSSSPAHGRHH